MVKSLLKLLNRGDAMISMIAAIGKKRELGRNNQLIWHIPKDMQFFKDQTMGKPMVMGYNTFYSLRGGKPLPGRHHIILTSRTIEKNPQITVVRSMDELLQFIEDYGREVMVIGGAKVYNSMLEYADKLILTEIDAEDKDADVYFPVFNREDWLCEELSSNTENDISYKHLVYTRK